jgi:hypothetical protein
MEISQETKSQAQNVVSTQFGLLKVAVSYIEKYINDQFTKQYSEFPTQLDEMRKLISMISTCCETHILEGMVVICTHVLEQVTECEEKGCPQTELHELLYDFVALVSSSPDHVRDSLSKLGIVAEHSMN